MHVDYQDRVDPKSIKPEYQLVKLINHYWSDIAGLLDRFSQPQRKYSPSPGLIIIVLGIALADFTAMVFVQRYLFLPFYLLILFEITVLTVVVIPLLYVFSLRPLLLQNRQLEQSETILHARVGLMQYADNHTLEELLVFSIDEAERLTGSTIGFFHFLNPDQKTISLQAWSSNTTQNMCLAQGKGSHYALDQAGVWADAVRWRKPIVHNDYEELPNKKGLPEDHAAIIRELVTPILREKKVVGILGVGNKRGSYTPNDMLVLSIYADFAWDVVERKKAEFAIRLSEQKFRTLVDWTYDWEIWVDPDGQIVYTSPSCERITGYKPKEFILNPKLMVNIVHPGDKKVMEQQEKAIDDTSSEAVTLEFRIIARDGSERWIEHICRPLYGADGQNLGRRISNRDITDRKYAEKQILEHNQKELVLTQTIHTLQTDIGRDLHDTLGNQISFLRMNLEHISESEWNDPKIIRNQLQKMTAAANESYEMVRAMLAVLQADNLSDPLRLFMRYADQIADRASFNCEIISKGSPKQLTLHQLRQLFYIFREAMGNIEKYAKAKHVTGEFIWNSQSMSLVIRDDGIGFDLTLAQTPGHYGLRFMRERAEQMKGCLSIQSIQGHGTTITVELPYEPETEPQPSTG